jgi:hypothetical protein
VVRVPVVVAVAVGLAALRVVGGAEEAVAVAAVALVVEARRDVVAAALKDGAVAVRPGGVRGV